MSNSDRIFIPTRENLERLYKKKLRAQERGNIEEWKRYITKASYINIRNQVYSAKMDLIEVLKQSIDKHIIEVEFLDLNQKGDIVNLVHLSAYPDYNGNKIRMFCIKTFVREGKEWKYHTELSIHTKINGLDQKLNNGDLRFLKNEPFIASGTVPQIPPECSYGEPIDYIGILTYDQKYKGNVMVSINHLSDGLNTFDHKSSGLLINGGLKRGINHIRLELDQAVDFWFKIQTQVLVNNGKWVKNKTLYEYQSEKPVKVIEKEFLTPKQIKNARQGKTQ